MREFKRLVRFGTEKTVGFPRLIAIFGTALCAGSSMNGRVEWGARSRILGLAKC